MKTLGTITLGLCLIAAPLTAQDTTHARHPMQRQRAGAAQRAARGQGVERGGMDDMMPMMREMMAPMMRVIAYTPDHLLAHKDSLQLTSDQVSKLTAIQGTAKSAHDAAATDFKTHMDALSQAFQTASPDTAALRPHFEEAHTAMGKAHWAMLAAAAQARAVLTDAQRSKIDNWISTMDQRRGY